MNNKKKNLKTANQQILTKTQLALEAIKNYQMRTQTLLDKNKNEILHPFKFLGTLQDKFDHLHYHKKLQIDKSVRVQLFPHSQDFYSLDTQKCLFPIRIILKSVRNQTTIYVGYDIQFPGMSQDSKNYDYKTTFKEDKMIVMKNPTKKQIRTMNITFVSQEQISMFSLKVDYIGYQGMDQQKQKSRSKRQVNSQFQLKRTKTQGSQIILPSTKNFRNYSHNNLIGDRLAKKVQRYSLDKHDIRGQNRNERQLRLVKGHSQKNYLLDVGQGRHKIQELNLLKEQQKKKNSFLSSGLLNYGAMLNNSKSLQYLKIKKNQQIQTRVKMKKQANQEYKQKNRIMNQKARKFKKLIADYQIDFKISQKKKRQINNTVSGYFVAFIFINRANILYSRSSRSIQSAFTIRYFEKKFIKKLINIQINNVLLFSGQNIRLLMGPSHIIQLNAKFFQKKTRIDAGKVISNTIQILLPGITLNNVIQKCSNYRRLIRKVQRNWISKLRARLTMLQIFGIGHVRLMLKEYPHLKLAQRSYIQGNINSKVAYDYVHDESDKFKVIYQAYQLRVEEINKFIQKNKEIVSQNQKLPINKQKQYLHVPKMPTPPQQRFFRNLDILRSMIRGWFQLQYKKMVKKNTSKK